MLLKLMVSLTTSPLSFRLTAQSPLANGRFDAAMKAALTAAGGTGFTFMPCSNVPAYQAGVQYASGAEVSFQG